MKIDPECSFFESVFKKEAAQDIRLSDYISFVREGKYKAQVQEVRRLRAIHNLSEADKRKKCLPALTPGGLFRDGRSSDSLYRYSGCVVADFDDVPGDPADWLRRAQALSYVKAGHISPSASGLKLFVMTDATAQRHLEAFRLVTGRLEADLPGIKVDPSGKDLSRSCFVSYDPGAFYKEESERLSLPVPAGSDDGRAVWRYLDGVERNLPFVQGGRHDFVLKAAIACSRKGFALAVTLSAMLSRYASDTFPAREIEKTVTDGYQRSSAEFGVNSDTSRPRRPHEPRVGFPTCEVRVPEGCGQAGEELSEDDGSIPSGDQLPVFPDWLYDSLPPFLSRMVSGQGAGRRRDMVLMSGMAVVSACLPEVCGYYNHRRMRPHLFVFIEGPSGSGKGVITPTRYMAERYACLVEAETEGAVAEYRKAMEEYELLRHDRLRQKPSARQPLPPRPKEVFPCHLFIPPSVSKGKLLQHLAVNGQIGGLMFTEEAENLSDANEQRYGRLMASFRNIAMHEEIGESFKTDDTYRRVSRPCMAMVVAGTLKQFVTLLPSAEDGMMGRMLFYHNGARQGWIDVTEDGGTDREEMLFRSLSDDLYHIALHLRSHPIDFHFTNGQLKELNATFDTLTKRARCLAREEMEGITNRGGMMLFRVAMILTAVRHASEKYLGGKVYCSDDDFHAARQLILDTLAHSEYLLDFLAPANQGVKRGIRPQHLKLLHALPDHFTRKEAQEIGKTNNIEPKRVNEALSRCEGVYVVKLKDDKFKKTGEPPM